LTYLATYPIKSCYRVEADSVEVERWGLAGDRRWLVVDGDAKLVTQRDTPALGRILPEPRQGGLLLRAPGAPDLWVPFPDGVPTQVRHFFITVAATPAGEAADRWISGVIGRQVRLVWLDDPTRRPGEPGYSEPGDFVSFADGFPLLLTNAASLDAVNDWLVEGGDEPVGMTRFRPNAVVSGAPAWAEDGWVGRRIVIGDVTFRVPMACSRCVLTTIDPETGEKGRQPLQILGRHRRFPEGLLFGVNLIPDHDGKIAVGDEVIVA
jgi:uncharacterized protein YcbX